VDTDMKLAQGWLLGLLAVGLGAIAHGAAAQGQEEAQKQAQALVASLNFRDGEVAVPGAEARFRLDQNFRYLEAADARKVLEQLWGNPPDDSVLGLVVPRGRGVLDEQGWAVVVTYSDDGYVSDEDAAEIDYAELLQEMKDGTKEENAARKEAGYGGIDLIGWAEPPHYDATAKKLYWAKELAFEGSEGRTLNYDIRVLGRRGYLSLNAISGMEGLKDVQAGMRRLMPQIEFDQGARYADYDSKTDKVAAYGIAALIGGGLAAKAGLFAKLGVLLLGLKKLLIPLVIVIAASFKKILGWFQRDKGRTATVS
jgi:uncharacterized membrane-anchored protein